MKLQPAEKQQRNRTVNIHCIHSKPWSQVEKLQTQATMFIQTMHTNDVIVLTGVDYMYIEIVM